MYYGFAQAANQQKKSFPCTGGRRRQEMAVGKMRQIGRGIRGRMGDGRDGLLCSWIGKEGWSIFAWADKNAAIAPGMKGY